MYRFLRNNGLSVAMFGIFAVSLVGMSIVGWHVANDERTDHHWAAQSYAEYVASGEFVEAVFENWESEFLQMWALVMLTIFLRQKGASDSKPLKGRTEQDTRSRLSIVAAGSWKKRSKGLVHWLYAHSLGLALLSIFIISFILHAVGGAHAYNDEAMQHNRPQITTLQYIGTSTFWFESLQNWQSEFLAVGTLLVLSIYLRERGSQQSKPVGRRYNHKTGE